MPPPSHPAPPPGWRPISGLALASFLAALMLAIFAAMSGLWIVLVLPLALGLYAFFTLDSTKKRGRMLGMWAVLISAASGSCTWYGTSQLGGMVKEVSSSLLNILAFSESDEDRSKSLRAWTWPEALEKDPQLHETWNTRFASVVALYGPWKETIELPSQFEGVTPLYVAPDHVVEVGTKDALPLGWKPGSVLWARAVFEKGTIHVAVVLENGEASPLTLAKNYRPGEATQLIGDLRFYRPKGAKAP